MELVPYEPMTNNAPQRLSQGVSCGVYITADLEDIDWMIARFERWFAERNEVVQVDEGSRSEEHTSELQSPCNLVCRLLLEKKKLRATYGDSSQFARQVAGALPTFVTLFR